MNKGDLLYIYPIKMQYSKEGGVFAFYQGEHIGDEDLSNHGSPFYETFLYCTDIYTGENMTFGNQDYRWAKAKEYIDSLEKKLAKIKADLRNITIFI